jgi:hypothetical protein
MSIDRERQRCYDAESSAFSGTSFDEQLPLEELVRLAAVVTDTTLWAVEAAGRRVHVAAGRRDLTHAYAVPGDGRVRLPKGAHDLATLAHELAHVAAGPAAIGHGSRFRALHVAVVHVLMGANAATRLRTAYVNARLPLDDLAVDPGPSVAGGVAGVVDAPRDGLDVLAGRVAKLLDKAASTDSPAEAAALEAKALELMQRHRLDTATIAARRIGGDEVGDGLVERHVHLGSGPYVAARYALLDALASAQGCKVFYMTFTYGRDAFVVGHRDDVSLALASHALLSSHAAASMLAQQPKGNAVAFRRAFLMGYARETAQRIEQQRRASTVAAATAPVDSPDRAALVLLANRRKALDAHVRSTYGPLRSVGVAASRSAAGYEAGRSAARNASTVLSPKLPGRKALNRG